MFLIPKDITLSPAQLKRFEEGYGHRDYKTEWRVPVKDVGLAILKNERMNNQHLFVSENCSYIDEWGIGHVKSSDGTHFERLLHPLADIQDACEITTYPFPSSASDNNVLNAAREVIRIKDMGYAASISVAPVGGTIFWPCYKLRGMENYLCDLAMENEIALLLTEKITDLCVKQARLAAHCKPDIIFLADDLGTQVSTYMSPLMFRKWIKPALAKVISAAKTIYPNVLIKFHSDGAIQSLIPDLIEIGVDILNPIQPECMDPILVHELYGHLIALNGSIGTQYLMPFGTVQEVIATTHLYCENIGSSGGFWIAPTHVIEPEVPWENIMAFINTASKYE